MQENKRMGTLLAARIYRPDAAHGALFAGKCPSKPCFNGVFCLLQREETQPERKRVGIIVFAGRGKNIELLAGRVYLLYPRIAIIKRTAHTREAIGDHRLALPRGTCDDCPAIPARERVLGELLRGGGDDGGIIVLLVEGMRAAILDLVAQATDVFDERVLGLKSGVVGSKVDFHTR